MFRFIEYLHCDMEKISLEEYRRGKVNYYTRFENYMKQHTKKQGYSSVHTIDSSRFDYSGNIVNLELSKAVSKHDNDENHQPDRIAIIFRKFMAKHPGGVGKKKVEE